MRVGLFRRPVMCDPPSASAVAALAGKLAAVDGPVNDREIARFAEVFSVPPGQKSRLLRMLHRQARWPDNFQSYVVQLGQLHRNRSRIIQWVLDGLSELATADAPLHPFEHAFLQRTAELWGLEYDGVCSEERPGAQRRQPPRAAPPDEDHRILGVPSDATEAQVREAWRRLARRHHPDRARSESERDAADRKLREINAAYGRVIRLHGRSK